MGPLREAYERDPVLWSMAWSFLCLKLASVNKRAFTLSIIQMAERYDPNCQLDETAAPRIHEAALSSAARISCIALL